MSILKLAVDNHLRKERMDIRQLLECAYYKRYGHFITQGVLDEDVIRWEKGVYEIPYLRDFMLPECAH